MIERERGDVITAHVKRGEIEPDVLYCISDGELCKCTGDGTTKHNEQNI